MLFGRPGSLRMRLLLRPVLRLCCRLALVLPLAEFLFLILLLLWTLLHRRSLAHKRAFVLLRRARDFGLGCAFLLRPVLLRLRPILRGGAILFRLILLPSISLDWCLVRTILVLVRPSHVLLRTRFILRLWRLTIGPVDLHPLRLRWTRHRPHLRWTLVLLTLRLLGLLPRPRVFVFSSDRLLTPVVIAAALVSLRRRLRMLWFIRFARGRRATGSFGANVGRDLTLLESWTRRSWSVSSDNLAFDDSRRRPHLNRTATSCDAGALRLHIDTMRNLRLRDLAFIHPHHVSVHRSRIDEGIARNHGGRLRALVDIGDASYVRGI